MTETRERCASLIGSKTEEIAFVKNTSEGICTIAFGLNWSRNDRILINKSEYSSNVFPWLELKRRYGVKIITIPETIDKHGICTVSIERLFEEASDPRTVLISLSHVEYSTGQRFDLESIGKYCRSKNILFCVDAIQSIGIFPIDVNEMNIDFLVSDGHKWLMSTAGAGLLYIREGIQKRVNPLSLGWLNIEEINDNGDLVFVCGAKKYEAGSLNIAGIV